MESVPAAVTRSPMPGSECNPIRFTASPVSPSSSKHHPEINSMTNTPTALPAHRRPGTSPSRTCLPPLVPSCQEKGQAPGCDFFKETALHGIRTQPRHIITFDLEEHFHASRFDAPMRRRHWSSFPSRTQENIEQILESLAHHSTKATFFCARVAGRATPVDHSHGLCSWS